MASKKRSIAVLVYVTALLQVLGFCFKALSEGSPLAQWLSSEGFISNAQTMLLGHASIGILVFSLFWTFFNWSPIPFAIMGSVFLLEALAKSVAAVDISGLVAFASEAVRYLWLFIMAYALRLERTLDIELSLPSVRLYLRYALGISLAMHGLEALYQRPELLAIVQKANHSLALLPDTRDTASKALFIIGAIDLLLAFLLVLRPSRGVLMSMASWGILSALALLLIAPQRGIYEALLRAPNYLLPLLILSVEGQKTISPRRTYYRMLKKIRAQQQAIKAQTRSFVRRS